MTSRSLELGSPRRPFDMPQDFGRRRCSAGRLSEGLRPVRGTCFPDGAAALDRSGRAECKEHVRTGRARGRVNQRRPGGRELPYQLVRPNTGWTALLCQLSDPAPRSATRTHAVAETIRQRRRLTTVSAHRGRQQAHRENARTEKREWARSPCRAQLRQRDVRRQPLGHDSERRMPPNEGCRRAHCSVAQRARADCRPGRPSEARRDGPHHRWRGHIRECRRTERSGHGEDGACQPRCKLPRPRKQAEMRESNRR